MKNKNKINYNERKKQKDTKAMANENNKKIPRITRRT